MNFVTILITSINEDLMGFFLFDLDETDSTIKLIQQRFV